MNEISVPWYKQFWPWFLIAFPLSAVLGGIATIIIAMHKPDGLVVDEYYKEGLAINRTLARQQYAIQHAISAQAVYDPTSGALVISLAGQLEQQPAQLSMKLVHPTLANLDQDIQLFPAPEQRYSANMTVAQQGNWHVILEPDSKQWQLTARVNLPDNNNWQFTPE